MSSIVMDERPEDSATLIVAFRFSLMSSLLTISTKSEKDNTCPVIPNLAGNATVPGTEFSLQRQKLGAQEAFNSYLLIPNFLSAKADDV